MSSKYWSKKVDTTTNKESWQESFPRETTVSPRAIQALDVLLNFSGSWAAAFSNSYSTFKSDSDEKNADGVPQNPRWRVSKLGYDGFPELNFVPYNYRTNAFGSKGGSLIGHPISFSVVGPTLKSTNHEWEWSVDGANNKLTLSNTTRTLTEIYGDLTLGISEVPLFLTISETGAVRTSGGVGENLEGLITTGSNGIYPVEEYGASANFEIFRVVAVNNATGEINLDPNKPLSKYFTIPDTPVVKGVMMFRPYVTRLAAVPESGDKGGEKTFMVVSPERSAFNDLHEPVFIQTEPSLARYASAVQSGFSLPIPIPLKTLKGTLESTDQNATKADGAGVFRIYNLPTGHGLTGGEIIHITEAVGFKIENVLFETNELLGWFEVIENAGANGIILRREIEANPFDGTTNFGKDLFLNKAALAADADVNLSFTVHERVSEIFSGDYNPDKVEACRLKNLIDPAWVDRTTKQVANDTAGTLFGGSAARADRAIFTTNTDGSSYADSGSLLDLGFRMVLFPAKDFGGNAIPDYEKPITSLETLINTSSQYANEKQTITIDYSAGTVTLSHPPTRGGTITPSGIIGEAGNNPRGEVVLFAACVPFSMEEGQTGVGVSVTGGELATADHGKEALNFKSVLGDKVHIDVINVGAGVLNVQTRQPLPPRGRMTLVKKDEKAPNFANSGWSVRTGNAFYEPLAEFGYKSIALAMVQDSDFGKLYKYHLQLPNLFSNQLSLFDATLHDFVLRKSNPNFTNFNDDSFYGSAWRTDSIRFAYADLTTNIDGSITVMPTAVAGPAQELRGLFPLGSTLELGRVAFDRSTQRWKVSSAPYEDTPETHQIGFEVTRGKTYLSDSNTGDIESPQLLITLVSEIRPIGSTDQTSFVYDPATPPQVKATLIALDSTPILPPTGSNDYKLKALVEAQTVFSKILDWGAQTWNYNRLVIALKKCKGTDDQVEAIGNPIDWVSVPIPNGQSLATTITEINTITASEYISYPAQSTTDARLSLTDRFLEVLPAYPYIKSADASKTIAFLADTSMIITIKSADPFFPNHWITFPLKVDAALSSNNPIEIAAYLNRPIYDRNHQFYVGNYLNEAGFVRGRTTVNPYLSGGVTYGATTPAILAGDVGERQILFAANDDPRHPAHGDPTHIDYNKIILLCGGLGYGKMIGTKSTVNSIDEFEPSLTDHFYNVLVEIAPNDGTDGIVHKLGFEFANPSPNTEVVRCGLFFTQVSTTPMTSEQRLNIPITSSWFNSDPQLVSAIINEDLFGSKNGLLSISHYLGTHDFERITWSGMYPMSHNLVRLDGWSDRVAPFEYGSRNRIQSFMHGTGTHPNLNLWQTHKKFFIRPDFSLPDSAGFYGAWISYTNQTVETHEFTSAYLSTRDSFLPSESERFPRQPPFVYSLSLPFFGSPEYDGIQFNGDQVYLRDASGTTNGIVLNHVVNGSIMVLLQDFEGLATRSFRYKHFQNGFDINDPYKTNNLPLTLEILPSNAAIENRYRSTMSVSSTRLAGRPNTTNSGAQSNITFIMGGHVELLSNQGAINPAGVSFGTFTNAGGFLSHMEQGVFLLGGFGNTDSEPFYSNLNNGVGEITGATIGAGSGTSSKSSFPKRGVAGIRFSGDTQIWLENIHKLWSGNRYTAAVIGDSLLFGENILGKGVSSHLMAASGLARGGNAISEDIIGTHAPFLVSGGQNEAEGLYEQTNVLLGLTQKDFTAWGRMSLEAITYNNPTNKVFGTGGFELSDRDLSSADTLHEISIIKHLKGKWLKLELPVGGEILPYTSAQNEGTFQIIAAPVIATIRNAAGEGIHGNTLLDRQGLLSKFFDFGTNSQDYVAVLIVRVARHASPDQGFKTTRLVNNPVYGTGGNGYKWQIMEHYTSALPLYCAEVSETGGAPTGINKTINGLTINPRALGKPYLPFQLVQDEQLISDNNYALEGKLFGVIPMADSKGSPKSLAYFSVPNALSYPIESVWRGIVRSYSKTDLVERTFQNAFSVNQDGRVQYQQKQRLGLGVVVDGGLGVVHATGFRANPRPVKRESLGAMSLFGNAGYPLTDFNGATSVVHLPSVFDTSEFVDDLLIVGAKSALIFEDARGSEGLVARLKENVLARQLPANSKTHNISSQVYPNDSILPFNSGGIVFKGSGSVKYERTFNYLNSNSNSPVSSFLGKTKNKGMRGLGIPQTGAYFLLPKGPSNLLGSGRGKANWNSGNYGATTSSAAIPADSVPLYEFVQSTHTGKASFGLGGILDVIASWTEPQFNDPAAPSLHKATGGSAYQGYRHAESRGSLGPFTNSTDIQVRLLEGMVVENTTNGTFYSLGETGRHWIESQYNTYLEQLGKTSPVGVGNRPSSQGSRIFLSKNNPAESALYYDLNPFVGFKNTHDEEFCWGTGDRTDTFIDVDVSGTSTSPALTGLERCHVRNTLVGHNLRVTANVEFVPILGKHDIDGGLLPPMVGGALPQVNGTMLEDADAIFYSKNYNFKKAGETYGAGDIGKFLYICGTDCYQYTGWWVVTDVIESYALLPSLSGRLPAYTRSVAVVRKWKRENNVDGNPTTAVGALPLKPRSPMLRTCSGASGTGWYNRFDTSNLILGAKHNGGGPIWQIEVPAADIQTNGATLQDLVNWLNATAAYNGQDIFGTLKTTYPSTFLPARPNIPFIKWAIDGVSDSGGNYNSLTVSYDLSVLDQIEKDFLIGGLSTFCGTWQSNAASAFPMQTTQTILQGGEIGRSGFFSRKGVNSSLDIGLGDRNNSLPMVYNTSIFTTPLSLESESAARGLRWVFSHPLTEEHTGGYLHLHRPVKDHFDHDAEGFVSPTADGDADAPFWVSRFQTYADVQAETFTRKTDIFRINRCPSTYNIVVGGDCELYHREPLTTSTRKGDTSMIYSPLSVDYTALWRDTDKRAHPAAITLFDASSSTYSVSPAVRANRYSIQPVARERIVAINPSSGESNVILDESPAMLIHQIEGVDDGTGSPSIGVIRVVMKNPNIGLGQLYPPQQSLSVGTPIKFRFCAGTPQLTLINDKVGYIVEIEDVIIPPNGGAHTDPKEGSTVIKVYIPTITIALGTYVASSGMFSVTEGIRPYQIEGTDASTPWKLLGKEDLVINSEASRKAQEMNFYEYGDHKRQWFPASRWWQVMNPITYYGYTYDSASGLNTPVSMNNAENPNVLRIDLTEAFTQAQQSGSGLGSPIGEKMTRGARLNRIWVNFGLWGNPMSNPLSGIATADRTAIPAFMSATGAEYGTKIQAMTFNLVLQLPAARENTLHKDRSKIGQGSLPFNGRAPTASKITTTSHLHLEEEQETFGTIVIPLYVNREAGDLSPNINEKFASFGVGQSTTYNVYDWEDGDGEFGLGVGSAANNESVFEVSHNGLVKDFVASSTTPVVWGGIDTRKFVKEDLSTGNAFNMLVSASLNPRSSILARNPMGEGHRGESFGMEDFSGSGGTIARSLNPQAITGITIAHSAMLPLPPREYDGSRQMGKGVVENVNSAPHSFTVALTPVSGEGKVYNKTYSHTSNQFISPASNEKGKYWNILEDTSNGNYNNFSVGNWLDHIATRLGFSSSMLPSGAKVYLEVTVPHTRRSYETITSQIRTSNGCWVGQVLCSFDVETADGTASSLNVNILGED